MGTTPVTVTWDPPSAALPAKSIKWDDPPAGAVPDFFPDEAPDFIPDDQAKRRIDLSAGFVPKQQGEEIDLSAGFTPKPRPTAADLPGATPRLLRAQMAEPDLPSATPRLIAAARAAGTAQPPTRFELRQREGERGVAPAIREDVLGLAAPPPDEGILKGALSASIPAIPAARAAARASRAFLVPPEPTADITGIPIVGPRITNALAAMIPGLDVEAMHEAADRGDTAGVFGHTVTPAALAVAPLAEEGAVRTVGATGRGMSAAREAVGRRIYTDTGKLRPGAKMASQVAGGTVGTAAGSVLGHPYVGGIAGYKVGPAALEAVIPVPEDIAARATEESAATEAAERSSAARAARQSLASRTEMRYTPSRESGSGPSYSRTGVDATRSGARNAPARMATPDEASAGRRVILPGERVDPMRVESAGSAAQATDEALRRLAAVGDESAKWELVRRRKATPTVNYSRVPLPSGNE